MPIRTTNTKAALLYTRFMGGDIDNVLKGYPYDEKFLKGMWNNVSLDEELDLFQRCSDELNDENASFWMGAFSFYLGSLGALEPILKYAGSPHGVVKTTANLSKFFNDEISYKANLLSNFSATVTCEYNEGIDPSKDILGCNYTKGIYSGIPSIWNSKIIEQFFIQTKTGIVDKRPKRITQLPGFIDVKEIQHASLDNPTCIYELEIPDIPLPRQWGRKLGGFFQYIFSGTKLLEKQDQELVQKHNQLKVAYETLEEKVAERTAELNQSLDTITKTQDQLVQSEKMAALGSLVAGVAHEVNTPIGIAVSAASHLEDMTSGFVDRMASSQVKRSDLDSYTKTASTASTLILKNLNTAVKIVQGFKQVAVDQTSGERREFKLKAYIEDVLLSLQPKLKKTKHSIQVDCPDDLLLNSYPGAFSQIISNLIMNSLIHGFEGIETGEIIFEVRQTDNTVLFIYKDNGRGMTNQTLARIFDPFFTTKRSRGGSGLGMHIVNNLVTRTLGGNIVCDSRPDKGITLTIQIPMTEKLS